MFIFLSSKSLLGQEVFVTALKMLQVKVPPAALSGHSIQLECVFALEDDSLYAVKWYRGVDEFYRFVPAEEPHATVFSLNVIEVDVSKLTLPTNF